MKQILLARKWFFRREHGYDNKKVACLRQNKFGVCALKRQIKMESKTLAWQERYDEKGSPQVWQGKYICATMHK